MVDTWTKWVQVEPLKNKNQGVLGEMMANFLGQLGYFDKVELAFHNSPYGADHQTKQRRGDCVATWQILG